MAGVDRCSQQYSVSFRGSSALARRAACPLVNKVEHWNSLPPQPASSHTATQSHTEPRTTHSMSRKSCAEQFLGPLQEFGLVDPKIWKDVGFRVYPLDL